MKSHLRIRLVVFLLVAFCLKLEAAKATPTILVSVPDQRMVMIENGVLLAHYRVSTSKYGLGDRPSSYATPLGTMEVAAKVGAAAPLGAVFKGQRFTGEILRPNTPGRDPIVTRILHLRGLESCNSRAFSRGIYIHGTPAESMIGRPASYGCIRMRSRDVVRVFAAAPVGTKIEVMNCSLRHGLAEWASRQPITNARRIASN